MGLGSILLLTASTVILHSFKLGRQLDLHTTRDEISQRFAIESLKVLQNLDSHRLPIPPRIHHRGQIAFTDRTVNGVTRTAGPNRPSMLSDAITTIELAPVRRLTVLQAPPASAAPPFRYYACGTGPDPLPPTVRSYIGLSADGMFELVGPRQAGASGCAQFTLTATRSMSIETPPGSSAALVRTIIPVLAHYTLYRNQRGELRYLSHRGEINDENQPIAGEIGELAFRLIPHSTGLFALTAERRLRGYRYSVSHTNLLARESTASLPFLRP